MNFATIFQGKVQNLIVANSKEIAEQITGLECIQYDNNNPAHIGLGYDEKTKTFEQPPVQPPKIIPAE